MEAMAQNRVIVFFRVLGLSLVIVGIIIAASSVTLGASHLSFGFFWASAASSV